MWLKLTILPPLGARVIRFLGKTLQIRTHGGEAVDALYRQGHPIIIAFWHGRQLLMPLAYRGEEAHILISQHRDGELIQRVVTRFGFRAVRGSSTRGGAAAFRQLVTLGRAGKDLVVTPDGPKGPRHVVQAGVIKVARATGLPIVPLTFSCSKKKSSGAGTASSFRTQWGKGSSSGARLCGYRAAPRMRTWRPSGSSSKRR